MRAEVAWAGAAAFFVGVVTAGQSRLNGELAVVSGDGLLAATVSMAGSLILAVLIALVIPRFRRGAVAVVRELRTGRLRPWYLLGGIFAAIFLATQSLTVPVIGVAIFTVALVSGQLSNSLVVDRLGWGPAGRRPLSTARILSAAVTLLAVVIGVSASWGGGAALLALPVIAALIAGFGMAVQQALNGHVAMVAREPMSAALVNFAGGLVVLLVVALVTRVGWGLERGVIPWDRPYLLLGGIVGVVFIVTAAWVVQVVGILFFALTTILGQLSGALVLDLTVPAAGSTFHWQSVVAVVVAALGVLLAGLPAWRSGSRRTPLGLGP
ncbi:MAG: DMT family transporter [Planctomycetota bacterium]